MARIAVITHEFDTFMWRRRYFIRKSWYLLFDVLREMERRGHSFKVYNNPPEKAREDIAIFHVDSSVVPDSYFPALDLYPLTVNAGVTDVTKQHVSGALLDQQDEWGGPVIVKSNLNYHGIPEKRHNEKASEQGKPRPHPSMVYMEPYEKFKAVSAVPDKVWQNPGLVVERFIAEKDDDGYAMRTWVFMGEQGRCVRHVASEDLIKGEDIIRRETVGVPEEMKALRKKLGFDFGKFDFVIHEGKAVLLDANKTPGLSSAPEVVRREGHRRLADGLEEILAGQAAS